MKERGPKPTDQREKDDALMNFVSYQAQEAILNPDVPDVYKDQLLKTAIETIHQVAERKAAYFAKFGEGRKRQGRMPYVTNVDKKEE